MSQLAQARWALAAEALGLIDAHPHAPELVQYQQDRPRLIYEKCVHRVAHIETFRWDNN